MSQTRIHLLRHGETTVNNGFRGRLDDPLSETGWRQMVTAVEGVSRCDVIVTSPLVRCAAFAREQAQSHRVPLMEESAMQELDFGQWEGRTAVDILETEGEVLNDFWRDPLHHSPPGGEDVCDFVQRVTEAWEKTIKCHQSKRILLFTHGGVIRVILCLVKGLPFEQMLGLDVPHAARYDIEVDHQSEYSLQSSFLVEPVA